MAWKLVIELLMVMTCEASDPACPAARPPLVTEMVMASEAACLQRADAYRRLMPLPRPVVQTARVQMEQQTTIRCVLADESQPAASQTQPSAGWHRR
jgi:hypothetical protein